MKNSYTTLCADADVASYNNLFFSATANRSASGSFAKIIVLEFASAVRIAKSKALFPSSGFGNFTVGKSGSASFCSWTGIRSW